MLASELDFNLPPQLIAQQAVQPRDAARLLRFDREILWRSTNINAAFLSHHRVRDLPDLLRADDLLVFNDTRVLRARLHGRKKHSGGRVEAILLREEECNVWQVLLKPSARLKVGGELEFVSPDESMIVAAELVQRIEIGWRVRFHPPQSTLNASWSDIREVLPVVGEVPLPPYIHQSAPERDYQTVFARSSGDNNGVALDSAAAPTAGLHFTPALLQALAARGIQSTFVTLGVGVGTFRPVQVERLEDHVMHAEEWEIGPQAAAFINAQKARGGRVVAVGTTTTRVLESAADAHGKIAAGWNSTSIFIRPGYQFRCVDALMTNFHLPRSTLLAMVSAFIESHPAMSNEHQSTLTGVDAIKYAYKHAIDEKYRFFSFGDAMLIE